MRYSPASTVMRALPPWHQNFLGSASLSRAHRNHAFGYLKRHETCGGGGNISRRYKNGDNALGQPVLFRYSDYAITVLAWAVLTIGDHGDTVTMSSLIKVERVKQLGEYGRSMSPPDDGLVR
ncbi:hypothetical protein ACFVJ5_30675 [Nocardia sp. NPDC127606]|uniref:hypothetical protein n=1 Tax=Nocardia sp. NPDC127606 TaxID=3345406 RepID=UPI00364267DD